jgi:hypothetical protein
MNPPMKPARKFEVVSGELGMSLWITPGVRSSNWAVVDPANAANNSPPSVPGVYAIYFDDELVHIGQSNDLRARLIRHDIKSGCDRNIRTPWRSPPDLVKVTAKFKRSRRNGDWARRAIRLTTRLQPRFNQTYVRVRAA